MRHYRVNHNHVSVFEPDEMTALLVTKRMQPSLLAVSARVPFLNAAPGQYAGSSQITSMKSCWPLVMLSAHILNCWPLTFCLSNLWPVCTSSRASWMTVLHVTDCPSHVKFIFCLPWQPSTVPLCPDVCLEINFSRPSSAYRFCDICILAAGLQKCEGYVNDFHSSSFSVTLLPFLICCPCAFVDTHTRVRARTHIHTLWSRIRLCAPLQLLATRVQKFTLFPSRLLCCCRYW